MNVEFRRANARAEIRGLMAFDRKVFRASDRFPADYWRACEAYWMLADKIKVGCCAFQRNVDFQEDLRPDGLNPHRKGSLYISTTGILPKYQGLGFGQLMKSWQICFARFHGFSRIVTNTRKRNAAMVALNRKFGFKIVRTAPGYYSSPADAAVVMEILLEGTR
jgi:ribosomal protein S18 acetylase RimI-like enzyme